MKVSDHGPGRTGRAQVFDNRVGGAEGGEWTLFPRLQADAEKRV